MFFSRCEKTFASEIVVGECGAVFYRRESREAETQRVLGWALRAILGNRLGEEPVFIMGICNYENEPL